MYVPVCFVDAKQFKAWRASARMYRIGDTASSICEDCTPEYQAQMIREKRCAYPATEFDLDKDGFLRGYRRRAERQAA